MSLGVSSTKKPSIGSKFLTQGDPEMVKFAKQVDEWLGMAVAVQDHKGREVKVRFNTDTGLWEHFDGKTWKSQAGGQGGQGGGAAPAGRGASGFANAVHTHDYLKLDGSNAPQGVGNTIHLGDNRIIFGPTAIGADGLEALSVLSPGDRLGLGTNDPEFGAIMLTTGSIAGGVTIYGVCLDLYDGCNIVLGTTTGTKIGSGPTQKLAFYGQTPVDQPAAVADAEAGTIVTQFNTLLARMRELGLIATAT